METGQCDSNKIDKTYKPIQLQFRAARIILQRGEGNSLSTKASAYAAGSTLTATEPEIKIKTEAATRTEAKAQITTECSPELQPVVSGARHASFRSAIESKFLSPTTNLSPAHVTLSLSDMSDFTTKASTSALLLNNGNPFFSKSVAQVAPLVAPKMVRPMACELKLGSQVSDSQLSDRRRHPLGVRFSESELSWVKEKAKAAGVSTNSYIRASALKSDYEPPRNPELVKALLALNLELTRHGNNINQIAKHLNNGTASPAEAEGMLGIIARTHIQTHRAVRVALSEGKEPPL